MNTDRPFALLITWTCYGTWLPGYARGYVSNTLPESGGWSPRENMPGTPYTADDAHTNRRARTLQKWPTVWLTAEQSLCVAETLVRTAEKRHWRIVRAAVMANHVHVLLMDGPDDGPAVRRILKGNTQAALTDQAGHPHRWWTEDGSDRYKHDWPAIEAADVYVQDQLGKLAEVVDMVAQRCAGERAG